jgi:hypothetical protein
MNRLLAGPSLSKKAAELVNNAAKNKKIQARTACIHLRHDSGLSSGVNKGLHVVPVHPAIARLLVYYFYIYTYRSATYRVYYSLSISSHFYQKIQICQQTIFLPLIFHYCSVLSRYWRDNIRIQLFRSVSFLWCESVSSFKYHKCIRIKQGTDCGS